MTTPDRPKFGVKFPSRHERARTTKLDTSDVNKHVSHIQGCPTKKPTSVRKSSTKVKSVKKVERPATLVKPVKPKTTNSSQRTLQMCDLEKLAFLNCSREFSLFHRYIKSDLPKSSENQLAFLQTKLQHLKNDFLNKHAEHLNFEQIKDYYQQAVKDNLDRQIQPDEYLTIENKLKQDIKQVFTKTKKKTTIFCVCLLKAIDKWIRKKDFKRPKYINHNSLQRQELVRNKIKKTLQEQKRQQQLLSQPPVTTTVILDDNDDDDDIMVID